MKLIHDGNFIIYAAHSYMNPNCASLTEFNEDLNKIKNIKKLFNVYKEKGVLKERLILNHLITMYNVFETQECTKMLVYKLLDYIDVLKSFLVYLNYWPAVITGLGLNDLSILGKDVESDPYVDKVLEGL